MDSKQSLRNALLVLSLTFLGAAVSTAKADNLIYNIDFTATGGVAPESGSFAFDTADSLFSSFEVDWGTFKFDLTSEANSPFALGSASCLDGASAGPLANFNALTGCIGAGGGASWSEVSGESYPSPFYTPLFLLCLSISNCYVDDLMLVAEDSVSGSVPNTLANGTFGVSAATAVPEPRSLVLWLLAPGLALRKRIATGSRLFTNQNDSQYPLISGTGIAFPKPASDAPGSTSSNFLPRPL
jgi:hypothetical protein